MGAKRSGRYYRGQMSTAKDKAGVSRGGPKEHEGAGATGADQKLIDTPGLNGGSDQQHISSAYSFPVRGD